MAMETIRGSEEKVVHWGLLGFQHQQRLAVRLTILFKDRQGGRGWLMMVNIWFNDG